MPIEGENNFLENTLPIILIMLHENDSAKNAEHSSSRISTTHPPIHFSGVQSPQRYVRVLYLELQVVDGVVCHSLQVSNGHFKWAKLDRAFVRPVLVALDLSPLFQVGDHHDSGCSLLPH